MTTFTTEDREWAYWHSYNMPKYNRQTEIEFFWPLTEQVPLDLDYSECKQSSVYMSEGSSATFGTGSTLTVNPTGTSWVTINSGRLDLDVEQTTIITKSKPPIYRRALYKLMGISWKLK
jgi:hypothetical protein